MSRVLLAVLCLCSAGLAHASGYTPYDPYTAYAPSKAICKTNPSWSECNGTQEQCEAYPSWSQCNGTLVQCEKYPSWSQCNGTRVQCEAYPSWSQCNGTRAQCDAYPTWSQCRDVPPKDPCDTDYHSEECLQKRCQTSFTSECRDIYCRYHPEDGRCYSSPTPPDFDPQVDQLCRSHGYSR